MYQYLYRITTAKKIENFTDYQEEVIACVKKFNQASQHARNYKHIVEPITFEKEAIEFIFESQNNLGDTPSLRPLWLFSKLLLDISGLKEHCIHKRFLKPLVMKRITSDYQTLDISENELLKTLIDIYMPKEKLTPYMNELNQEIKVEIKNLIKKYRNKRG